jgi:hypothetical protein
MARLRPMKVVNVLTFEETTRVANFFMLLVEINVRLPKTTKAKTRKRATRKTKHKPIKEEPSYIKCPARRSSRTAQRDLFLKPFTRILRCNTISFTLEYRNDRHHSFIAYS